MSLLERFALDGKTAIVTGSSRGIGAAIAIGLAEAGARVLLVSRGEPLPEVSAALQKTGQSHSHLSADLGVTGNVPSVVATAIERLGRVDILVNNAGLMDRAPLLEQTEEMWDRMMNINLKVPFFLAQACARHMIEKCTRGKIINLCSIASVHGGMTIASYAAAKHALVGVTRAMANELAPRGINVNAIAPGYIATDLLSYATGSQEISGRMLARVPAGRFGTPGDIVGSAIFLASQAAEFIHGEMLMVDGGFRSR